MIWHEIAASVPGRTNKDCRKRWYGKTASEVEKGAWTALEDERLLNAVTRHGTKWSVVAPEVRTRTGDQCSKRWSYTVNPDIDRSAWTPKEVFISRHGLFRWLQPNVWKQDELLLDGVIKYGRNWQQIKSIYFPRRTSLGSKNRYHLLRRRSDGARSYSKSQTALVSDTAPATVHAPEKYLRTEESDSFDSDDEIDEDMSEENDNISAQMSAPEDQVSKFGRGAGLEVQPNSRGLKAGISNSVSGDRRGIAPTSGSWAKLADPNNPATQVIPDSGMDFLDYTNATSNLKRTQRLFRQPGILASFPPTPQSAFGEHANCTAQNTDGFASNFSHDAGAGYQWDDQYPYGTGMVFANEPRMLGLGPSFSNNNPSIESSSSAAASPFSSEIAAAITPAATPTSSAAASQLPPFQPRPSYAHTRTAHLSTSDLPSARDQTTSDNTQRFTIEVVCFKDALGPIMRAVTDLSLSVVFK